MGHNSFLLCKFRHKFLRPHATFSSAHKDDKRRRNGMMSMDIGQAIGEIFDLSTHIILKRPQTMYLFNHINSNLYEVPHSWLTFYLVKCEFTSTRAIHLCHFHLSRCTLSIISKNISPEQKKGRGLKSPVNGAAGSILRGNFGATIGKSRAGLHNGFTCMLHVA